MKEIVKLNLGCGTDKREGYVNIDSNVHCIPNRIMDVRDLDYKDNEVDEILARDILEHIPIAQCGPTLTKWFNILKPKGKIIIQVPNLRFLAEKIRDTKDPEKLIIWMKRIFGGQDHPGNFHNNGFTPEIFKYLLEKIGFKKIKIFSQRDLNTPNYDSNMVVEAEK